MSSFEILAFSMSPDVVANGIEEKLSASCISIAAAAQQAGCSGIVDLAFSEFNSELKNRLNAALGFGCGLRLSLNQLSIFIEYLKSDLSLLEKKKSLNIVLVPNDFDRTKEWSDKQTQKLIQQIKGCVASAVEDKTIGTKQASSFDGAEVRIFAEIIDIKEIQALLNLPVDAIIAKGQEASGVVGETTAFVLMQECLEKVRKPVYVWGGIGLHTAPACYAAGAAGVILDSQLLLTKESSVPLILKAKLEQFDGTELQVLPLQAKLLPGVRENKIEKVFLRVLNRNAQHVHADQLNISDALGVNNLPDLSSVNKAILKHNEKNESLNWIVPLGQDVAFASTLAQKYASVAGILQAIKSSVDEHISLSRKFSPLGENNPLAKSHGTKYPILQGAMTRVSDKAEFALEVAKAGGLPFIALALMRGAECEVILAESKKLLDGMPWGVGILGFVPQSLKAEQMAALEKYKPPYVLIAGGRPDQAKHLEEMGIKTYLHVPSPLLLDSFIEMGSRRFIFEGKECGGHIGPRSSFILWESMIERLLGNISAKEAASYHIVFAGGIHDARSAAAVAALSAPLAARGVNVGILMGTAYLFTKEAVESGAIIKKFQEAAIECDETVLLETGPGHAIRCINSPYKNAFDERRITLVQGGMTRDQIREELELMNLGRLRLASKGVIRKDSLVELDKGQVSSKEKIIAELTAGETSNSDVKAKNLESATEVVQWQHGMYMIGQIASMHDKSLTMAELHEDVCNKSSQLVASLANASEFIENTNKGQTQPLARQLRPQGGNGRESIAIIGMSCLLPKAKNLESYWTNIINKVDAIEEVPLYQWDWRNYYDPDPLARDKIYSKWGGFLEDIEFDPTKYGIPPSSLNSIDPMQILLLEITDAALKDAGYDKRVFPREKTSVILANAGHGPITAFYSLRSMLGWKLAHLDPQVKNELEKMLPEWTEDSFPGYLGNVTAGRVANRFDLGGVNFSIDAACASSLAALYTAVAELRAGNSDVVFLASTDTHNQPGDYLSFSKTHAFSADGHCKTFDSSADGIVISEGMAMVVLKRLSDAERDGDRIYAVIKGVGGSSDGRDLSLTAPRPAGQIKALNRAYEDAQVNPNSVTLIEAHGTGTVAGDKAEVEALKQVFELSKAKKHSCAIGSVKTMIGHTKATAGLASLIKVAKALHHKVLPPTIGVKNPNPACHFEEGPFYINAESRPWILPSGEDTSLEVRRAGVSAFGFGGTNFHAVLEEYVPSYKYLDENQEDPILGNELFIFTAANINELGRAINACLEKSKKLAENGKRDELNLATLAYWQFLKDVEHQAQFNKKAGTNPQAENSDAQSSSSNTKEETGRKKYCLAVLATSLADLSEKLTRTKIEIQNENKEQIKDPRGIYFESKSIECSEKSLLAFLFPGQGSQYPGMLSQLAIKFAEVRETFAEANECLTSKFAKSLSDFVFPPPAFSKDDEARLKESLTDTRIAQPALGAADMAAYSLLKSFDIEPDMVAGHSYGEYVALSAAGYFDFATLMNLSQQRGAILAQPGQGQFVPGGMAAVSCSAAQLKQHMNELPKGISIANLNSPEQTVIAGPLQELEQSVALLREKNISARVIPVSQAFHTKAMSKAAEKLESVLKEAKYSDGRIDVYSNLGAKKYSKKPDSIPGVLSSHTVEPVDFVNQIQKMYADGARIFLEVGPGSVLTNLAKSILDGTDATCISIDRAGRDGVVSLLHALAQLAVHGIQIDFQRLYQYRTAALRMVLNHESTSTNKKLIYAVNSATIQLKGKTAEKPSKSVANAIVSRAANEPINNLGSDKQIKDFGNLKIENTPSNNVRSTVPLASKAPVNQLNVSSLGLPGDNSNLDGVMAQFQQSMQQMANSFMETQQRVMLAYLENQKNGVYSGSRLFSEHNTESDAQLINLRERMAATNALDVPNNGIDQSQEKDIVNAEQTGANEQNGANVSETEAMNIEQLVAALLEIVAERTGYPVEMIDPTLDLEADLGIDSIKRVEILNKFRRVLPDSTQKQLESGIEELAGARTLQGIIDWLRANHNTSAQALHFDETKDVLVTADSNNGHEGNGRKEIAVISTTAVQNTNGEKNGHHNVVKRGVVLPVSLPALTLSEEDINKQLADFKGNLVLITKDKKGLAENLAESLSTYGLVPVVLSTQATGAKRKKSGKSEAGSKINYHQVDLQNFDEAVTALTKLEEKHGAAPFFFHLQSFCENDVIANKASTVALLHFLKHTSLNSNASELAFKPMFLAATSMGGKFGHDLHGLPDIAVQAAIPGLLKVAAKEMPSYRYKAVDFEISQPEDDKDTPQSTLKEFASKLLKEALADKDIVEVGYRANERWGLEINESILKVDFSHSPLDKDSVVFITGGARGITAEIAIKLAELYKATFVLVGRSNLPEGEEDPRFAGVNGMRDIKAKIMEILKEEGKAISIPEVEIKYQKLLKERELRENMARLKATGNKVEYHAMDVRDNQALRKLIENVYDGHGKINVVIHGAGVIEDALLKDKNKESFERVFDTKVVSAITLLDALKLESLQHLFFFSSVVSRTGNAGQVDYVAANEVLNKLALSAKEKMVKGRAASILWGPWRGGMAHPELEDVFAQYGWAMIDIKKGCGAFVDEMFCSNRKETEIMLVAKADGKAQNKYVGVRLVNSEVNNTETNETEYSLTLDTETDAFLNDHAFDGVPVLPMAYALELMCEAAQATYPGLPLRSMEQLDIPAGILFDIPKKKISIVVQEEESSTEKVSALVSIISGNKRRVNFKARARLAKVPSNIEIPISSSLTLIDRAPNNNGSNGHNGNGHHSAHQKEVQQDKDIDLSKYSLGAPVEFPALPQIYKQWLFHGKSFHGMKKIYAAGEKGVIGQVAGLSPDKCLSLNHGGEWIIDPVMFDCSMQLGGIWARKVFDITALPTGFKRLTFVKPTNFASGQTCFVHIIISPESSQNELRCDMAIYDPSGELFIYVEDLAGVGSKSLHRLAKQRAGNIEATVSG